MNLEKLKETARRFEQKEDWRKAIDVYLKAIHQVEEGTETAPDLSLYNRIGDLYLKINDTASAVRSYERAVDLYADQGFFNNAIALCGKILRVNPGRTQTYLKLAQLHARKNVVIESKRNLIEFLERMNALGQLDQAFQSVNAFADQFSGSQEIRMMLVDLLRAASREDEAREQLEKLASELEAIGDAAGARRTREQLQAIDQSDDAPPAPVPVEPSTPAAPMRRMGDLVFLDTGFSPVSTSPAPGLVPTSEPTVEPVAMDDVPLPLAGLETMSALDVSSLEPPAVDDRLDALVIERAEPAAVDFDGGRLEGMEGTPLELDEEIELMPADPDLLLDAEAEVDLSADIDAAEPTMLDLEEAGEVEEPLDIELGQELEIDVSGTEPPPTDSQLPFLDTGAPDGGEELTSLEDRVLDDPDNPELHRDLADALFAADQPDRALDELELALAGFEAREQWVGATGIVDRFLAVYPDSIRHHQKRVELAYRGGDRAPLIAAYLGLGDALARTGAVDKAIAVFGRVHEHDPGNVRAATALAVLTVQQPPAAFAPPSVVVPPAMPPIVSPDRGTDRDGDVDPDADLSADDATDAAPSGRRPFEPRSGAPFPRPAVPGMVPPAGVPRDAMMPSAFAPPSLEPIDETPLPPIAESAPEPVVEASSAPGDDLPSPPAFEPSVAALPPATPPVSPPPASPPPASVSPSDAFVDFGAMVLDEQGPRDTRMHVDRAEPTGRDEQREFQEILAQFKRGIEENLDADDYDAHYDLGVAFKEMGLLDEAIAEFQRAARSPSAASRLRASEALGVAFCDKEQYPVAETVLRRALETLDGGDEAKIGLLYWLGRAAEAQGKERDAIASYERALAVDIRFLDLRERLGRLTSGRRS